MTWLHIALFIVLPLAAGAIGYRMGRQDACDDMSGETPCSDG